MDGQRRIRRRHSTVRDLHHPENPIGRDSRIEIMDLYGRPRTEVVEVYSYLYECTVRPGGFCAPSGILRFSPHIIRLIHADIRDYEVGLAIIVGRRAHGVAHRHRAVGVGYPVGIGINAIETVRGGAWRELIEKPESRN